MPYLADKDRLQELLQANEAEPEDLPELTAVLCDVIDKYVASDFGATRMEEAYGALEGTKLEFARRIVGPYEARKAAGVIDSGVDPFGFCHHRLRGA